MQFPHFFSTASRTGRPGLLNEHNMSYDSKQQQQQDQHKTAFTNKHYYPRVEKFNNNNKTFGGGTKKKNKTITRENSKSQHWKLDPTSTVTEPTLGEFLVEQDKSTMVACVVAPAAPTGEATMNKLNSHNSSHVASANERKNGVGGVVGKFLMLTKKKKKNRRQEQSCTTTTTATTTAPASPAAALAASKAYSSSYARRHAVIDPSSRTIKAGFSSSVGSTNISSLCLHHYENQHSITVPSPSSDSFIQEQGEFCVLSSLLLPLTTSCSSIAPTTYLLQKHEYRELGYMQFQYSIDDDDSSCNNIMQEAHAKASLLQQPILIVHAVVPDGDVDAGFEIFSHPLVVEAAQSLFVTVLCKTKLPVEHQQQRKCRTRVSFWQHHHHHYSQQNNDDEQNNPDDDSNLVPYIHGDTLTLSNVVSGMIQALQTFHNVAASTVPSESPSPSSSSSSSFVIPKYLLLLQEETNALPRTRTACLLSSSYSSLSGSHHSQTKIAVFGMDDSHLGEVEFAGCAGVLVTRAGHYHHHDDDEQQYHDPKHQQQQHVVQVSYDSRLLSYCSLVRYALQRRVGQIIYYQTNDERVAATMECDRIRSSSTVRQLESSSSSTSPVQDYNNNNKCNGDQSQSSHNSRKKEKMETRTSTVPFSCIVPDYDPKQALRKTPLKYVPLTSLQATRANRLIHYGRFNEAMHLLSPQQGLILLQKAMRTSTNKDMHEMVDIPIAHAWHCVCEQVHPKQLKEETNDVINNLQEGEEDTNKWGGRCFVNK